MAATDESDPEAMADGVDAGLAQAITAGGMDAGLAEAIAADGVDAGLAEAIAAVMATVRDGAAAPGALLHALRLLHLTQARLAALEPGLIAAARAAGVSWQELAPVLGVASRQAAERRYLRLVPADAGQEGSTRDERVRAERDRRAGHRAVARWANDNTADLRRLAGQVTALTDLGEDAAVDVTQLHRALADADAAALPGLLARTHRHLDAHPELAEQIDAVIDSTDRVRRETQRERDQGGRR